MFITTEQVKRLWADLSAATMVNIDYVEGTDPCVLHVLDGESIGITRDHLICYESESSDSPAVKVPYDDIIYVEIGEPGTSDTGWTTSALWRNVYGRFERLVPARAESPQRQVRRGDHVKVG